LPAAKTEVDLAAARRQDFVLQPMTDFEQQVRQCPATSSWPDAGEHAGRQAPEADRAQQLHELPHAQLHVAASLRRIGWNAIIQTMKAIKRLRHLPA